MRHEASLIDIEDNEEYEWLLKRIAESFKMERVSGGTAYFVNLHRLLYNTGTWTWGGPQKDRSFIENLPEQVSQDPCEQQLCARIRYAVGSNEMIGLGEMYCGGKAWQVRAICKKRVQPATPPPIEAFSIAVPSVLFYSLVGLLVLFALTIFLLVTRRRLARAFACLPQLHSDTLRVIDDAGEEVNATASYEPIRNEGFSDEELEISTQRSKKID